MNGLNRLSQALPDMVRRDGSFRAVDFPGGAQPQSLCFAATPRYLDLANADANISAVITTPALAHRADARLALAVSEAPMERFYRLHDALARAGAMGPTLPGGVSPGARIHPSAIVEDGACVEDGAEVDALAWIGEGSWIEAGACIGVGARVGVEGHFFKRFADGLFRVRHTGGVRIGARAQVMANAIVQRSLFSDFTEVGRETVLGPAVHLSHGVKVGARATIAGSVQVAGYTTIGEEAWIGPGAVIGNLLSIGDRARVEIGSVVVRSVAAGERVSGHFARPHVETLRDAARDRSKR